MSSRELPPALPSMWRLCRLGYRHEPGLLLAAFGLALLSALPDALIALWFAMLANGVLQSNWGLVRLVAMALGVSATATWFLRTVSMRVQRRFRDKVTIALESHVAGSSPHSTIAHQSAPSTSIALRWLLRVGVLLDPCTCRLFSTCGWNPAAPGARWLFCPFIALVLRGVRAAAAVLTSTWRPGIERRVHERGASGAPGQAPVRYLRRPPLGKRVRVTGIGDRLIKERRLAWRIRHRPMARTRVGVGAHGTRWPGRSSVPPTRAPSSSSPRALRRRGQRAPRRCRRRPTVVVRRRDGRRDRLPARHLDGRFQSSGVARGIRGVVDCVGGPAGARHSDEGHPLEHVSFSYPGTDRVVLDDVNLDLTAGAVVAIVGENGAGEDHPRQAARKDVREDGWRILIDGTEAGADCARQWRAASRGRVPGLLPLRIPSSAETPSALATCHGWMTNQPLWPPVSRAGADDVSIK